MKNDPICIIYILFIYIILKLLINYLWRHRFDHRSDPSRTIDTVTTLFFSSLSDPVFKIMSAMAAMFFAYNQSQYCTTYDYTNLWLFGHLQLLHINQPFNWCVSLMQTNLYIYATIELTLSLWDIKQITNISHLRLIGYTQIHFLEMGPQFHVSDLFGISTVWSILTMALEYTINSRVRVGIPFNQFNQQVWIWFPSRLHIYGAFRVRFLFYIKIKNKKFSKARAREGVSHLV